MQKDTTLQPPASTSFTSRTDPATAPVRRARPPRPQPPHPVRKVVIWTIVALVVLGLAYRIWSNHKAAGEKPGGAGGRGGPGSGMPVPVIAGKVQQKDVPIYLDGLGTVQALNTVTVHSRVDGEIEKIAFQEGQDVKEGDLLAQIDPAPAQAALAQAQAKQRQDEATLANAKIELQRDQELVKRGAVTPQQLDYQTSQVQGAEALVKNDQAAVQNAQVQLDYTAITSPLNGRTGLRMVDQGNIVHAADATGIVVITQLQPISLIFTLPEQNLADIHKEQQAAGNLEVVALGRDNKTALAQGKLTVIDNQIDTTTGSIKLKAEFPNTDLSLWPGQFANARLLLTTRKAGLTVPASVIQRGPENSYAYVINGDTVEMRPVKVAQIDGGEALLDEGLKAGESVVVDGQYKLQPGSKVKIGEAPGRPGAGVANPSGHAAPHAASGPVPSGGGGEGSGGVSGGGASAARSRSSD